MAGTMFEDLVSAHARSHRNWYTVPLSFLVHTVLVVVLIVVPLVATDVLPTPKTVLHYAGPAVVPIVQPPPRVRSAPRPATQGAVSATPLVAPDHIGMETGLAIDQSRIETRDVDGIADLGIGLPGVEAMPTPLTPAPIAQTPVRVGTGIQPPVRTKYVPPVYPRMAQQNRVQGTVVIEAIIGADGRVTDARVLRPHPLLDAAALAAVREWEYTPSLLNGRPTPVIMTVTVRFALH